MNEFLNPKSMVTPGVAGSAVMFLVNGVAAQFPSVPARWLALALSFLVGGAVVLQAARMRWLERLVYWTINSLVIFVVGFGTTYLGRDVTTKAARPPSTRASVLQLPAANADEQASPRGSTEEPEPSRDKEALKNEVESLKARNQALEKQLEEKQGKEPSAQPAEPAPPPERKSFFKPW